MTRSRAGTAAVRQFSSVNRAARHGYATYSGPPAGHRRCWGCTTSRHVRHRAPASWRTRRPGRARGLVRGGGDRATATATPSGRSGSRRPARSTRRARYRPRPPVEPLPSFHRREGRSPPRIDGPEARRDRLVGRSARCHDSRVTAGPPDPRRAFTEVDESAFVPALMAYLERVSELPEIRAWRAIAVELMELSPGMRVLDAGSGLGEAARELAALVEPGGEVTAIDLSAQMVLAAAARGGPRVSYEKADVTDLPFASDSFDRTRCERVLQHLSEPDLALAELARVTVPGGRVCVLDPDWRLPAVGRHDSCRTRCATAGSRPYAAPTPRERSGWRASATWPAAPCRSLLPDDRAM